MFSQVDLKPAAVVCGDSAGEFTSNRSLMGEFANPWWQKATAWAVALIILASTFGY
ncbi:hypothetical protein IFO70_08815 [Phormidium tenue FACHB-886]|nr:hypothetical protein [Phormidium tenue FACHB-886]